jgi:hypothetical protein
MIDITPANDNVQTKEMLQEFAQQNARAKLAEAPPLKPVRAEESDTLSVKGSADTSSLLVSTVDVKKGKQSMQLLFKCPDKPTVGIVLTSQQMRQWLAIIRDHWKRASWPMSIWPSWIGNSVTPESIETGQGFH